MALEHPKGGRKGLQVDVSHASLLQVFKDECFEKQTYNLKKESNVLRRLKGSPCPSVSSSVETSLSDDASFSDASFRTPEWIAVKDQRVLKLA